MENRHTFGEFKIELFPNWLNPEWHTIFHRKDFDPPARIETAKILLAHGAVLNHQDKNGDTPLHAAAAGGEGCQEMVEFLLDQGANIDQQNLKGESAFYGACSRGNLGAAKLLHKRCCSTKGVNLEIPRIRTVIFSPYSEVLTATREEVTDFLRSIGLN